MSRDIRYFGPRREPAVLVEDFGELREGMIIWAVGTKGISKRRHMLASLEPIVCADCAAVGLFTMMDPPVFSTRVADRAVIRHGCICRCIIPYGRVFAVIDEPPAKAESRARRRKLVTS